MMRWIRHLALSSRLLAMVLIAIGAAGILLGPSMALWGGTAPRVFDFQTTRETSSFAAVIVSEVEIPWIHHAKGLLLMHGFTLASLVTLFSGVHLFAALRRRAG